MALAERRMKSQLVKIQVLSKRQDVSNPLSITPGTLGFEGGRRSQLLHPASSGIHTSTYSGNENEQPLGLCHLLTSDMDVV
jgi:hypothetical protein